MGVFATNKFLGARLNGFEQQNDSTIKVIIRPENIPINKSPYYSFKVWSEKSKKVYLQFDYPKDNSHRYHPKIKKKLGNWTPIAKHFIINDSASTKIIVNLEKDTTWISAQEVVTSIDTKVWIDSVRKGKLCFT